MERSLNAASTATVPPRDLRPLILCGPSVLERDALMRKLWDLLPGSFTIATHHTTNIPIDEQLSLDSHYYISSDEFLNMASSGEFATYGTYGDHSSGVSRQAIAAASATGRIVVMEVDMRGVEQLKAIPGFDARYVFITPPSLDVFEARLSMETAGIYEPVRRLMVEWGIARVPEEVEEAELGYSRVPGVYDLILPSENLDEAFQKLVNYIYSSDY
ncbi:P-loop containing nucleoside triphosphate hydrolase protein [Fusarium solani]|uniref:P-loop containing nucleoside triphosphate hydrolase protein n=1 Tax=Fusarium solani TaxID=169388 RepID=A0A9P9R7E8_FUSSL|nr:P-loop containing nucleoside triphosphate hydrolase protein [Fusarium solani]KAH7268404.1 P-loop containing nucleoside triphosphate hydrolase protein [Fusarium solani]